MQRTQIFLTEAEQAGLQRLAKARGSTVSAMIREAVDRYLENEPAPPARLGSRIAARFAGGGLDADLPELHGQTARPMDFGA